MTTQPTEATMTDAELDALVARLSGATMGLCSEDASKYVPRGVSAQTCIEAAAVLTTLRGERDIYRQKAETFGTACGEKDAEITTLRKQRDELREALEAGGTRILILLGGERDAMPDHVVKAFQEIAKDMTAALSNMEGE